MQISAVILAGGEGTRLGGVDKGLIEFKGRRMIEWTLDIVRPCVSQLLISCNRNITDYMPLGDSVVCDRIAGSLGSRKLMLYALLCWSCPGPTLRNLKDLVPASKPALKTKAIALWALI